MRTLVLLRHGTAAPAPPQGPDRLRVLTPQGRDEAARIGRWMAAQGIRPDQVVASTAPRAAETARIVVPLLGVAPERIEPEAPLYGIEPAALLRRLAAWRGDCVLVVGHNPAIEAVALHLSGDEDLEARGLPPAGCVVLRLPDDWEDLGARSARTWTVADPASA